MEREILFRGKTCNQYNENDNGIWLEAFLSQNMDAGRVYPVITDGLMVEMEVIQETVGQFTGLLDNNGVKIFEGDILTTETDKPMIVGWSNKFSSFVLNRDGWAFSHWFGESCNPENCIVIGNIHDNPELLK